MKIEKRRIVLAFACVVACLCAVATARAQQIAQGPTVTNTYAAKFICGVSQETPIGVVPDAQPGRYSTKINVHNNTGLLIRFQKKFILLRGGEQPIPPSIRLKEELKPDYAMEVVCADIYKLLQVQVNPQTPMPYMEGFVIFEVHFPPTTDFKPPQDPLDVTGIYTYRGGGTTANTAANGASIDVVVYPAKSNQHVLQ